MPYTLEVDWDNDNSYGHAEADVWPLLIEGSYRVLPGPGVRKPAVRP